MSRYGRGTCELSIRVHTAHGIGHTIGCRACCHVVGMQSTACTAAGRYGEILPSLLYALLLVGTCYRMLESGWIGGVTRDGNVNAFLPHDSNTLCYIVCSVAVHLCS